MTQRIFLVALFIAATSSNIIAEETEDEFLPIGLTPEEMANHAMEDYDSSFATTVQENDMIVTGRKFGCGSSREQAVTCLKMAGVKAIIGKSFARIYYRNAINQALLLIESVEAAEYLLTTKEAQTQSISIDTTKGIISVGDKNFSFPPFILTDVTGS